MRVKVFAVILSIAALMISMPTASFAGIIVNVKCPASVKVGTALNVTATVENDDCNAAVSIGRGMTSLMGNSGGTLGNMGIWGPYQRSFTGWTAPKATCDAYGNLVTPGTSPAKSVNIITVPSTGVLNNKMATAYFWVISATGNNQGVGSCYVNVTP